MFVSNSSRRLKSLKLTLVKPVVLSLRRGWERGEREIYGSSKSSMSSMFSSSYLISLSSRGTSGVSVDIVEREMDKRE